jgi:hypothetical protein
MEDTSFILLWKQHYEKIDQTLAINKRLLKELLIQKAGSSLRRLLREKAVGIVAAVVWLLILGAPLGFALTHYHPAANYFIVSIGVIFLINLKALADYIRYAILLQSIAYDGSIATIQEKVCRLQWSMIRHCRIMALQFPFWSTFFLSSTWFPQHTPPGFIAMQIGITGLLAYIAYWLYRNLVPANLGNRWIKLFLSPVGGRNMEAAIGFYRELMELETTGRSDH